MDQRFHRALHFGARGRREFVVLHLDRTGLHLRHALLDDLHALAHLADADEVTIIAVAITPDRDFEVHLAVFVVRLGLAKVARDAGAADARAGKSPGQRLLRAHYADADSALLPDPILGKQLFQV